MRKLRLFSALFVLAACSESPSDPGTSGPDKHLHPGTGVTTELSAEQKAELDAISAELDSVAKLDANGFASKYEVPFQTTALGYDPTQAKGLELVQASSLALNANEQAALTTHGFTISERQHFPSFVYGYETIYAADLPVYISADSILYAVHESYDELLKAVEYGSLIPTLTRLLTSMRGRLESGLVAGLPGNAVNDADTYLSVTKSLLSGTFEGPVAGGNGGIAKELFDAAQSANGAKGVTLFDVERDVDFSQFEPRGHYTESDELKRYFKAMMWLGRIDFRMLETQPDHTQVFHRRQLEAAYVLQQLMDQTGHQDWKRIDDTIGAFVGEPDAMTVPELDSLLADLGVKSASDLANLSDQTIAQAIVAGGYGTQRISSHIMINGLGTGTMPLSSAFLFFGQRYVLDSHVFSNVVYDRVQEGRAYRMMPNPLDAAFAAFGNSQAGLLLLPELTQYEYSPDLASMRVLADAHPQTFWEGNLYNLWLGALRTLSPNATEIANPAAAGIPSVAGTEAWGRRLLNTQLASWAELRHDTILYAKQSYTGGSSCEFPDAYIDPYPQFFAKLGQFATRGSDLVGQLDLSQAPGLGESATAYFQNLKNVVGILQKMAEDQRTGAPHSAEHMAFINQAVKIQMGCGDPAGLEGWYAQLFFNPLEGIEFDPIIADVHTQPTDEFGNPVGKVLHVGTGAPRLLVVTVESCNGPHGYVGLASSYFEKTTENFERLTDEKWQQDLQVGNPADVPWMQDLVVK
jgi:hypothetical protein